MLVLNPNRTLSAFFSLIRAPNQFSVKSKVVGLLFLYNFYFDQISSCCAKILVLGAPKLNLFCPKPGGSGFGNRKFRFCSVSPTSAPIPATVPPVTPRVEHPGEPRPPCAALILAHALEASLPFPSLHPLPRARMSRARAERHCSLLRLFLAAPLESFTP